MVAIVVAIYFAPFLIGVIASGIFQFLIGLGLMYFIVKNALKPNSSDYDKYQ
jgi:hypothetical protein